MKTVEEVDSNTSIPVWIFEEKCVGQSRSEQVFPDCIQQNQIMSYNLGIPIFITTNMIEKAWACENGMNANLSYIQYGSP